MKDLKGIGTAELIKMSREQCTEEHRDIIIRNTEAFCQMMCEHTDFHLYECCPVDELLNNLKNTDMSVEEAMGIYLDKLTLLSMNGEGTTQ